jgi:hypothetical protein
MKRNFLRLCLTMIAWLSLNSCRQDVFPEQETYHNTSTFQLTSKRISLNESKHKGKLVSKIEQVENKLKTFSHTDAQGKIVNYGNGVSIDTESVIYIENGPNYHTYTFHITKANAPADAPIENLVLTPLPDGTYKELLVTYNLTTAEKLQAENGVAINTHGKAQITELAKGTYNNGNLQGKTITGVTCGWTEEVQYTVCDGGDHHSNGEATDEMGGPCHADNPSLPYLVAVYKCDWIYSEGNPFNAGGPGETINQPPGAPGAGAPISGTCPDNGVLTAPIDPTSSTNMECESGVPTQINVIIDPRTPCGKLKMLTDGQLFKNNMNLLENNLTLTSETGYRMDNPSPNNPNGNNQYLTSPVGANEITITYGEYTHTMIHTHYEGIYPMLSVGDLIAYNKWLVWSKNWNNDPQNASKPKIDLKKLRLVVVTELGSFVFGFDGTDVAPFSDQIINSTKDLRDKYKEFLNKSDSNQGFNKILLQKQFIKFIATHMNMPGLKVFNIGKGGDPNQELTVSGANDCP